MLLVKLLHQQRAQSQLAITGTGGPRGSRGGCHLLGLSEFLLKLGAAGPQRIHVLVYVLLQQPFGA